MEPLSRRLRATYLITFTLFFAVITPIAILYAAGYRLSDLSLVPTGGIYVVAPVGDAVVTLNGEEVGVSGLFTRSFYIDDLAPGSYVVQAAREGYYPWAKTLVVERAVVTDVAAFLVPLELEVTQLVVGTTSATSTRSISLNEQKDLLATFIEATTTATSTIATSTPEDTRSGQGLFIEEGDLTLRWLRNASTTPSGFCTAPSSCTTEFYIENGKEVVKDARFFGMGAVYLTETGGLYYAETDVRSSPLTVKIYSGKNAEFRLVSGTLVIKEGKTLYEVSGF